MAKMKERFDAMREATLEKIRSAAVRLFSQKGLAATSVAEIAEAAGISTGLMYRYYKSKEELFGALVTEALSGLEQAGQLFEGEASPACAIRMFSEEIIKDLTDGEEFLQYMMMLSQPFIMNCDFPWMAEILERDKQLFCQIASSIERGQKLGQFKRGDPKQMAQHYFSVIQGVCTMKQFMKDDFNPPTVEMMTAFIIKEEDNHHEAK